MIFKRENNDFLRYAAASTRHNAMLTHNLAPATGNFLATYHQFLLLMFLLEPQFFHFRLQLFVLFPAREVRVGNTVSASAHSGPP